MDAPFESRTACDSKRMPASNCNKESTFKRSLAKACDPHCSLSVRFRDLQPIILQSTFNSEPVNQVMTSRKSSPRQRQVPLAYFITFRSYGTWLHGRKGSVDRFHNIYGSPKLAADEKRLQYNRARLTQPSVKLQTQARRAINKAIMATCEKRNWVLWVFNVRTNHVHVVVSANCQAWLVLNALKANATREMREAGCWRSERSPWIRRGSRRYLWTEKELDDAIAYVRYGQGESLP